MSEKSESLESNKSDEEIIDLSTESIQEIELSVKQCQQLFEGKKAIVKMVKSKGKSIVWERFGKILVNGLIDKEIKSFNIDIETNTKFFVKNVVSCKDCNTCYTHISHKSGTSNLRKYVCTKTGRSQVPEGTQLITKFCTKITKVDSVPEKVKSEIQVKSLSFILNQLLAFKTVDEKPFRDLLQKCIEIGATYGNININDLMCGRKKLTNVILKEQFDECVSNINLNLKNAYGIGLSLDFWEEETRKITYISMTVHFVNENYSLTSRIINFDEFDFERKTADNIKIWFTNKLSELKIDKKYLIVSDNASNLVSAFRENRIPCICHSINLAIQSAVNELFNENSEHFCSEFQKKLVVL